MHGEMLTYGLKRGTQNELLHIDSVPNGLGCDCVCPHCKHELMAKNGGSKNTHHFAHASGTEECGKGRITALHILAQQVLANDMRVMLPDYIGQYYPPVRTGLMVFDEVQIEKTNNVDDSQIRPDCIGIKYDEFGLTHKLLIEIRVTHKVDEQKQQFIRNAGIACIEINLSDMLNTDYTKESVTQRLIEEKEDRVWICCPIYDKRNEENKQKRAKAEKETEEQRKRDEEEYRKAIRGEHRERIEEGRKREESKLREQQTQRYNKNNFQSSQKYHVAKEFLPPNIPLDKRDGIIQAVHGKSIIPTNDNYSEELAEEFNKLYQENSK